MAWAKERNPPVPVKNATISALLTHVRRADIVNVSSLRRGAAEAIEAVAHGDESTSKVVGRAIGTIKLPPGTTIGAVVRGEEVLIAHDNVVIEQGDHVVMFLVNKKYVPDVEALFQPSHCNKERHSKILGAMVSNPLNTVEPVVVIPDMVSK